MRRDHLRRAVSSGDEPSVGKNVVGMEMPEGQSELQPQRQQRCATAEPAQRLAAQHHRGLRPVSSRQRRQTPVKTSRWPLIAAPVAASSRANAAGRITHGIGKSSSQLVQWRWS